MKPDQATLLLFEAGALDPGQAALVAAWLARYPGDRATLSELDLVDSGWRLPPPGLGLGLAAGMPPVMSPPRLRPGDRHQLLLAARPDAAERLVVLLRRGDGGWQVDAPGTIAECLTLDRFPTEADGRHRIELVARGPAGRQRLAVALPRADQPLDWAAALDRRWAALLAGLANGSVPVGTVELLLT